MRGLSPVAASGGHSHRGARASHYRGLSCCGAQAPDTQAQQLWLTGPAAPWHVGSSQTRARTCVPCIGRQILNHCATREALFFIIKGQIPTFMSISKYINHHLFQMIIPCAQRYPIFSIFQIPRDSWFSPRKHCMTSPLLA